MLSFTIGQSSISVFLDGEFNSIDNSHANFPLLLDELRKDPEDRDLDYIRGMITIEKMLAQMSIGRVTVFEDEVHFDGKPVHNYMTQRMLEIIQQGLDIEPWARFMDNVFENPAAYAQNELYEWMEKANMPITPDGHFLAFKKVRSDYTDCHTGKFSNKLGNILEMDRGQCDPIRDNHCSSGFHFCSVGYLSSFGGQRVLVVKINPKDVTSIPNDYSFTKGRTCRYEVVAELSSQSAAHHKAWKKGLVNLENPAEFPADVLSKISLPSPALNEPITLRIKDAAVEDALDAIEAEVSDAMAVESTRQTWERFDREGSAAAVANGEITQADADRYMAECKTSYDKMFDAAGALIKAGNYAGGTVKRGAPVPAILAQTDYVVPKSKYPSLVKGVVVKQNISAVTNDLVFTTSDNRSFSADVVKAALEDASIRGAARNLGIQDSTLRGWKKKMGL